jgi:hypothetical protein
MGGAIGAGKACPQPIHDEQTVVPIAVLPKPIAAGQLALLLTRLGHVENSVDDSALTLDHDSEPGSTTTWCIAQAVMTDLAWPGATRDKGQPG